jgi:hypothetical protein
MCKCTCRNLHLYTLPAIDSLYIYINRHTYTHTYLHHFCRAPHRIDRGLIKGRMQGVPFFLPTSLCVCVCVCVCITPFFGHAGAEGGDGDEAAGEGRGGGRGVVACFLVGEEVLFVCMYGWVWVGECVDVNYVCICVGRARLRSRIACADIYRGGLCTDRE